ncbi:cytochrome P450 [Streptomyces sp. NPDC059003]|uniref:cytochrome P450 n=1 Tax=Streptomyces sp. NPDC059003 TaxID=3346691 RepID=UPI0036736E0B
MAEAVMVPGRLPLAGNAFQAMRDPLSFLMSLPAPGDVVEVRIGPRLVYVLCSAELTRQALLDDRTFDKGGLLLDKVREILGNGLATCPHSVHRRQRRLVQPAFHRSRMPGYADMMAQEISGVVSLWTEGQTLGIVDEMQKISSHRLARAMFAEAALAPEELSSLAADFTIFQEGVMRRAFISDWMNRLPTRGNISYNRAMTRLRRSVNSLITEYRSDERGRTDLLSVLMAAHDSGSSHDGTDLRLSDTELAEQCLTFLFGGMETTANALAWAIHLVARHPDIEEQLHAETDEILTDAPATYDDLPRLELTGRIIAETLRLYPPGWALTRTTTGETQLGNTPSPQTPPFVYSAYLLHRSPDFYPNPERFDPDRWKPGDKKPPNYPKARSSPSRAGPANALETLSR